MHANPEYTSADPAEIENFSRIAAEWWNPKGKFKPLHDLNPTRLAYIRDRIAAHYGRKLEGASPLSGLKLVDIGCGGGLVAEPMARLGASVTGIDASEKNIGVAQTHAQEMGVSIDYRCTTAEKLLEAGEKFDVVLALEIAEHVVEPAAFIATCCALVKPGGIIIFSTLNRTAKSFALAIVGAEYLLRWLPRGTHHWDKFIRPSELAAWVRAANAEVQELCGMVMNPISFKWRMDPQDLSVNYLMVATPSA